jgi:hypothetical protein
VRIAETALATAVTCCLLHGYCQSQELPVSGPAPSSYQASSVLFDMQQKLNDMRDQLAAQKASSPVSIWSLYDMRQKLNDMRDQIEGMRDRVQGMSERIQDTRDRIQDLRDQIQNQTRFRTEQMQLAITFGMRGLAVDTATETYLKLASHPIADWAEAYFGKVGGSAAFLGEAVNLGQLLLFSKGYIPLTEAPFVGLGYRLLVAAPDPLNPSLCGAGSCRASSWSRTTQTPLGLKYHYIMVRTPLGSSGSDSDIEVSRGTIGTDRGTSDAHTPPRVTPAPDYREPSMKAPVASISGCSASNDASCFWSSDRNALPPGRPPPNPYHSGGGGGGGGRGPQTGDPAGVDADVRPVRAGEVPPGLAQSIIDSRKGCATVVCGVR